mmetsp:Transcript_19138/g.41403  ORF Transcript_19138/g.41403 Transcript_19138/m.41403 type:complete len:319 (+) Transcript_19138:1259-2215(+)
MALTSDYQPSARTEAAIHHLKKIKPTDGYSAEIYLSSAGRRLVLLRRRNVQLGDTGFDEIVLDPDTECVVGVTSYIDPVKKFGRGVVLVESNGDVCRSNREVRVTMPPIDTAAKRGVRNNRPKNTPERRPQHNEGRGAGGPAQSINGVSADAADAMAAFARGERLSEQQNRAVVLLGLGLIGATIIFKVLASALFMIWILAFPLAFLYGIQTCPTNDSFDPKKELKRVMRGHNLPEDHPDKPKGWVAEGVARAVATVTTELATGISGYEVEMWDLVGAAKVATVRVPSINAECYWVGAFGRWTYVMQRDIEPRARVER